VKIQSVEISRYRAFYGTETLHFGGKNVFIYGENGSGKSSLYYALKDFFKSKRESVDFASVENIFLDDSDQGSGKVQVNFKPEGGARNTEKTYSISARGNSLGSNNDVIIDDANKLKSFLTYKHLLGIHNVKRGDAINLFDLLVNGVLQHFKYSLTDGKELGELWTELNQEISKSTDRTYPINRKRTVVNGILRKFNTAFSELFNPESPEYILRNIEPILDTFGHNVEIQLTYPQLRPTDDYFQLENKRVDIQVKYVGKDIAEPHLFLNEARLSAIAISIYLSMIKRHPQLIEYKILFLDDIFLGLDIGNRLPLLKILDEHFSDYQIFITTYDKPWFEYAKTYLVPVRILQNIMHQRYWHYLCFESL
jgi:energy-coupling factor transporter ATP-binding protein EcfA2